VRRSVCSSRFTFLLSRAPLLLFLILLALLQPGFARSHAARRAPAPRHPQIAAEQSCGDCHSEEFSDWQSSKHGRALVKCLVCHGAVDSNFIPRPTAARCLACHGEIVHHLGDGTPTKGKSCFDCHSQHRLNPHPHSQGVQP